MANINDEEDDSIVEEIPVYLSKNLLDNLYLFQYPTKTQVTNLDHAIIANCCVKPINKQVKIDFALDTDSNYYDSFKGERLALAADGKTQNQGRSSERPSFKRGIMDKQSFLSSNSIKDVNRYVVGISADKEMHLSPLISILQLRPSFSYFDKEDKRIKAEQKALNDGDDDEQLQQVTVKFARTGKKDKDKRDYNNFLKQSINEPWCETFWHSRLSSTAELERQKFFATNQQISHALSLEKDKYGNKLLPSDTQQQNIEALLPVRVVSRAHLKVLPLIDQLKFLLKDAKMLTFDEICSILQEILNKKVLVDKILRSLPQVGILMHGNWVPQSDVLYPGDTFSNTNGISAEQMIRARDYVLYRYYRTNFLYRRQVMHATQLPADEALEVLKSVARLNLDGKWELLLPPDKSFETRYPDLVTRQEMVWRATEPTFNEMDYEKSPKRIRKRSVRDSKSTATPSTTASTSSELATNVSVT